MKDEKPEVGEVVDDVTSDDRRQVMEKVEEKTEVIHHSLIWYMKAEDSHSLIWASRKWFKSSSTAEGGEVAVYSNIWLRTTAAMR